MAVEAPRGGESVTYELDRLPPEQQECLAAACPRSGGIVPEAWRLSASGMIAEQVRVLMLEQIIQEELESVPPTGSLVFEVSPSTATELAEALSGR